MSSWDLFAEVNSILTEMGGKGSGHHGHKGIKGRRGGSAPSKGGGKKYLSPTGRELTIRTESRFEGVEQEVARLFTPTVGSYMRSSDDPSLSKAGAVQGDKLATVTAEDFDGIERDWEVTFAETAGAMRTVWGHGKYSLLFTSRQTEEERIAEEEWLRQATKSDHIVSQIESQLALNTEGGWVEMGGKGSGNWGHKGRKGKRGGSAPGGGKRISSKYAQSKETGSAKLHALFNETAGGSWGEEKTWNLNEEMASKVGKDVAKNSSISEEDAETMILAWGASSADNSMQSLAMQEDAADEFGIEMTDYIKSNIAKTQEKYAGEVGGIKKVIAETHPESAAYKMVYGNLPKEQAVQVGIRKFYPDATSIADSDKQKSALRAMYNNTQKELKSRGITEVKLYRGMYTDPSMSKGLKGRKGENVPVKMNPLESWSIGKRVADNFSKNGPTGGVTFEMTVPIERIISIPTTGFGTVNEGEVVLLGGDAIATVREVY